jgi:hypothetical protein
MIGSESPIEPIDDCNEYSHMSSVAYASAEESFENDEMEHDLRPKKKRGSSKEFFLLLEQDFFATIEDVETWMKPLNLRKGNANVNQDNIKRYYHCKHKDEFGSPCDFTLRAECSKLCQSSRWTLQVSSDHCTTNNEAVLCDHFDESLQIIHAAPRTGLTLVQKQFLSEMKTNGLKGPCSIWNKWIILNKAKPTIVPPPPTKGQLKSYLNYVPVGKHDALLLL